MKNKDLILKLQALHPEAEVVTYDRLADYQNSDEEYGVCDVTEFNDKIYLATELVV